MESKAKRPGGNRISKATLPATAEEYLTLDAEKFALFLVGKTLEVFDEEAEEPLRVSGIIITHENSEKDVGVCKLLPAMPSRCQQGFEYMRKGR